MTVWQLHMLNARGALTPILAEIRAHAREVVELVSAHLDLPRFDLVVRAGGRVIPDWGIAGHAPAPGIVELTLDPARVTPEQFRRTLVREMHHLARWEGPGHGRSLGEALVSEGLAGHFVLQVLGGAPDPRDRVRPHAGAWRQAATLWARQDHDFGEWFLGRGAMRKWTGYGMGHRLVAAHLAQAGGDAASLVHAPAEPFRAALRRLMAEAGAPEGDTMPDDDSTPGGDPATGGDRVPDGARALGGDPGPEDRPAPGDDPAPEDCPAPGDDPAPEDCPAPGGDPVPGGRPAPEDRPAPGGDPAPRDRPAPEGAPASGRGPDATPEAFGGSRADADRPEAAPADADPEAGAHDAVPFDATLSERDAPDAIPPDAIPPDAIPPDAAPLDAALPGANSPGAPPPDAIPLGAAPPGTTSPDATAVGVTPPDAIPPDAIPLDAAPPDTTLRRAAPPDATPPGAARREDRDR